MPAPHYVLSGAALKLIDSLIDQMFDRAKSRFLGKGSIDKRILFGRKSRMSLPGLYLTAAEAEGVNGNPRVLKSLLSVAENYLDASRANAKAKVVNEVSSFLADAKAQGIDTDVETVLNGKLTDVWGEVGKNVKTIIDSEAQNGRAFGALEGIVKINEDVGENDPVVYFVVVHDEHLCDECKRLHLNEDDVTPRLWRLSECKAGYHKRGDNEPSIAGEHPHCRCTIATLMPGYGFDHNGHVTYKGPKWDEWEKQRPLEKAEQLAMFDEPKSGRDPSMENSPAFKHWFNGSQITENNRPKVVYHGTNSPVNFSEFSTNGADPYEPDEEELEGPFVGSSGDPNSFLGAHFSDSPQVGSAFTGSQKTGDWRDSRFHGEGDENVGGRVIPAYLSLRNPLYVDEDKLSNMILEQDLPGHLSDLPEAYGWIGRHPDDPGWDRYDNDADYRREVHLDLIGRDRETGSHEVAYELAQALKRKLLDQGYDGVVYPNEIEGGTGYIAFHPHQIKSVFNRGTWSPEEDDIGKSESKLAKHSREAIKQYWEPNVERFRQNGKDWEDFINDRLNPSLKEHAPVFDEKLLDAIQKAPITVNFNPPTARRLLKDGKFLNAFHPDANGGDSYSGLRPSIERDVFGFPFNRDRDTVEDLMKTGPIRPIYGALAITNRDDSDTAKYGGHSTYGAAWAQLHDHVKNRSTFTGHDTFAYSGPDAHRMPVTINHPKALAYQHLFFANPNDLVDQKPRMVQTTGAALLNWLHPDLHKVDKTAYRVNGTRPIEAQIHGGVHLPDDVHSLHYSSIIAPSEVNDMVELGKKYNLPVFKHDRDTGKVEQVHLPLPEEEKLGKHSPEAIDKIFKPNAPTWRNNGKVWTEYLANVFNPSNPDFNKVIRTMQNDAAGIPLQNRYDFYHKVLSDPEIIRYVEEAPITMNFPHEAIAGLMRRGRFVNTFANGTPSDWGDERPDREKWDESVFKFPRDLDGKYRPVYGALHIASRHPNLTFDRGGARGYGDYWAELKPHVKDRSTFTGDDTAYIADSTTGMSPREGADLHPVTSEFPRIIAFQNIFQTTTGNPRLGVLPNRLNSQSPIIGLANGSKLDRFINAPEAHIHGGVDLSKDVASLHYPHLEKSSSYYAERAADRAAQLVDLGKKYNIPVFRHGEQGDIQQVYAPTQTEEKLGKSDEEPEFHELQYVRNGANLGGAGEKHIYEGPQHKNGSKWLVKPALSKAGEPEPFRADVQQALSRIERRFNPVAVPIHRVNNGDNVATVQPLYDTTGTLRSIPPSKLTDVQKRDVGAAHVADWLMSQHDSHPDNFIVRKDGRIAAIDKEQAFRYFPNDRLALDYNPNAMYGTPAPYYNNFWHAFADNRMDFDPQQLEPFIRGAQSIPDHEYLREFSPYLDKFFPPGTPRRQERENAMLARKANLRTDFEHFLTQLHQRRHGTQGSFTFDKGWVPATS